MRNSMQREAEITSDGGTAMNPDGSENAALAYQLWKDRVVRLGHRGGLVSGGSGTENW